MRALALAIPLLSSCATLEAIGIDRSNVSELLSAVPDVARDLAAIGMRKPGREMLCPLYGQRARGLAEHAWERDWPHFQPMFESAQSPEADEQYCRQLILSRGAEFFGKSAAGRGATALSYAVGLPADYHQRSPVSRAALMCHEAAHVVWQKRVGVAMASVDYATASGRIGAEAVGYAITEAIERRHGVSETTVMGRRKARSLDFPVKYALERSVDGDCVHGIFGRFADGLEERRSQ